MAKEPSKQNNQQNNGGEEGQSLEGLHKAFGDMTKQMNDLPNQISRAVASGIQSVVQQEQQTRSSQDKKAAKPDPKPEQQVNEADLEKMSRAEFANYLTDKFASVVDQKLEPVQESMSTTIEESQRERVQARFNETRKKYPDFDSWKDEMNELVQQRGYLDPEELYVLVRHNNPEKAKELDQELGTQGGEQDQNNQDPNKQDQNQDQKGSRSSKDGLSFLGLMPTSGGQANEGDEQKFETTKDAAEAAYDALMGDIDESIIGEANQT